MDFRTSKELIRFASIGAQAAVRRVFNREDGERFLQNTLGGMPGAPAKIGQLLGMRAAKDIPSPAPIPLDEVKAIIRSESSGLAAAIESLSAWSKTASIGQTHQATLKNGDVVAIKVQYPGVVDALSAQIDLIFGLAGYSPARKYELDVGETRRFIGQKLLEESDYRLEAVSQQRYYDRYAGSSIVVPRVYHEFSTSRILTQSWEDATGVADWKKERSSQEWRRAGEVFSALLFDSMLGLGLLHTDLNPSNYGFRVNDAAIQMVLYDFGSTCVFTPDQAVALYRWIEATRTGDRNRVRACMEEMGFAAARLEPINAKLLPLSEIVLKPLLVEGAWDPARWDLQRGLDEVLGQDKWWFRTAGPPWFMYFMRSAQGWHHAMTLLAVDFDLGAIWSPWEQQLRILSGLRPEPARSEDVKPEQKGIELRATSLRVVVSENNEDIVDLTLPARAIEDLEDLIPDHVREACQNQNIDLVAVKKNVIAGGGDPQELFTAAHGNRHYRVWLV